MHAANHCAVMHTLKHVTFKFTKHVASDTLVTGATNAGMSVSTANDSFDQVECSYGYDRSHTPADDADVALVADRPPTAPNAIASTANHKGRGQNVVYVDGHVEFVISPLAGWYFPDGTTRDNIYIDDSTASTDTYIEHDG